MKTSSSMLAMTLLLSSFQAATSNGLAVAKEERGSAALDCTARLSVAKARTVGGNLVATVAIRASDCDRGCWGVAEVVFKYHRGTYENTVRDDLAWKIRSDEAGSTEAQSEFDASPVCSAARPCEIDSVRIEQTNPKLKCVQQ